MNNIILISFLSTIIFALPISADEKECVFVQKTSKKLEAAFVLNLTSLESIIEIHNKEIVEKNPDMVFSKKSYSIKTAKTNNKNIELEVPYPEISITNTPVEYKKTIIKEVKKKVAEKPNISLQGLKVKTTYEPIYSIVAEPVSEITRVQAKLPKFKWKSKREAALVIDLEYSVRNITIDTPNDKWLNNNLKVGKKILESLNQIDGLIYIFKFANNGTNKKLESCRNSIKDIKETLISKALLPAYQSIEESKIAFSELGVKPREILIAGTSKIWIVENELELEKRKNSFLSQ